MPDIIVVNESTLVSDTDLATWTAAVQQQITNDVAPFWGVSTTLHNIPKGTQPPSGEWWMVVLDDSDIGGDLGYHDLGDQGQPMGKVFARTTMNDGWGAQDSVSRVLSHETIELLVDPMMVKFIELDDGQYQVEPGDPLSVPSSGYQIDNVLVSAWATPAYYHYNTDTRYDFRGALPGLLPGPCPAMIYGSYLPYRPTGSTQWQSKQAAPDIPPGPELDRFNYLMRPRVGSRRHRRMMGRANWLRSTPVPPQQRRGRT
jgi:hypothetical protein